MEEKNITPERKREIDEILKESLRKYESGELECVPLEVFLEEQRKKREWLYENICDE